MSLVSVNARNASLAMSYGALAGSEAPTSIEVGLFDGDPANGGTEVTGGGYARPVYDNDGVTWPDAPSGGSITSIPIEFADSTGAWDRPGKWFQIFDADTGDEWDACPLAAEILVPDTGASVNVLLVVNYVDPAVA